MSTPSSNDPRLEQAAITDESLIAAHEKLLGKQPDERARYSLTPLVLLFVFSGLIFWAGTYLNRYSGHFDPVVFNENAHHVQGGAAAVPAVDPMVVGKKVYDQICITCHMPNGQGQPGIYPPLAGSEWVSGSEDRLISIVLYGLKGPIKVKDATFNAAAMPRVGKVSNSGFNQSDERIAAVLTYIRQQWGNNSPAITAEKVAALHAKMGDHPEMVQDELMKMP